MKERISPAIAGELLKGNTNNRPVRKKHINWLAKQMADGKWMYNGASIVIAKDGAVLDGQHRLMAVLQSGATIETEVVRGVERNAFTTIDTGKKRSGGDALYVAGVKNGYRIAAIIIKHFALCDHRTLIRANPSRDWGVTNEDILEQYQRHPAEYDQISNAAHNAMNAGINVMAGSFAGGIMAYLIITCGYDFEFVHKFIRMLYGESTDFLCIRSLHIKLANSGIRGKTLSLTERHKLIACAWYFYVQGNKKAKLVCSDRYELH